MAKASDAVNSAGRKQFDLFTEKHSELWRPCSPKPRYLDRRSQFCSRGAAAAPCYTPRGRATPGASRSAAPHSPRSSCPAPSPRRPRLPPAPRGGQDRATPAYAPASAAPAPAPPSPARPASPAAGGALPTRGPLAPGTARKPCGKEAPAPTRRQRRAPPTLLAAGSRRGQRQLGGAGICSSAAAGGRKPAPPCLSRRLMTCGWRVDPRRPRGSRVGRWSAAAGSGRVRRPRRWARVALLSCSPLSALRVSLFGAAFSLPCPLGPSPAERRCRRGHGALRGARRGRACAESTGLGPRLPGLVAPGEPCCRVWRILPGREGKQRISHPFLGCNWQKCFVWFWVVM